MGVFMQSGFMSHYFSTSAQCEQAFVGTYVVYNLLQ